MEVYGFLANRKGVVARSAVVGQRECCRDTEELDAAIAYGPGLRWALMGTCLTFHLAGVDEGMKHML